MNKRNNLMIYFERVAVGFLLFSATGVTAFARSSMTWEILLMPALLGALALVISLYYGVKISPRFVIFIGCYLGLFLCQWLIYGSFHPKQLVLYPFLFWVAYCFVGAMQERFLFHLEFLITRLAGISLVIWSLDVMMGGVVRQLLSGVSVGQPYNNIVDSYIIIQTFINESVPSVLPRNSGFAWEPGAFAVFCCAGLMINFYRTNFRFSWNLGAALLIAALLSSQSTTGYSILATFLLVALWRKLSGGARLVFFPALAATLVLSMLTLPFMQNKIDDLWSQDLGVLAQSASRSWNAGQPLAAQRFLSFQLDFSDFLNNPWTGYGGADSESLLRREGLNVISISGIGKIMARFGILGIGFFIWSTVLSSNCLSRQFRVASPALLALFILLVSISYSLIEHPLFMSIWCYWFFARFGAETLVNKKGRRDRAGRFSSSSELGRVQRRSSLILNKAWEHVPNPARGRHGLTSVASKFPCGRVLLPRG